MLRCLTAIHHYDRKSSTPAWATYHHSEEVPLLVRVTRTKLGRAIRVLQHILHVMICLHALVPWCYMYLTVLTKPMYLCWSTCSAYQT